MFKRVQFEEWQAIITVVAFICCFAAFIYFSWRAIRMKKRDRQHMSNLPLESEDPNHSSHDKTRESQGR